MGSRAAVLTIMRGHETTAGYTLVEVLFVLAIASTLAGIAVPMLRSAADDIRAAAAARALATTIMTARLDAVRRSAAVGLRFEDAVGDYVMSLHVDGNGNGIRTTEIRSGTDPALGAAERLGDRNPGIRFGLLTGIPDVDGGFGGTDGVRIGVARILVLAPTGGATSGTLYLHGKRSQYAVRVLGATGRVRVFHYNPGARQWNSR